MRRLIFGDVHGNYLGLREALDEAAFDPNKDELYGVGDYIDGYPQVREVVDYLAKLPKFRGVIGNHDQWLIDWFNDGSLFSPNIWYHQGGKETLRSYGISSCPSFSGMVTSGEIPNHHKDWFENLEPFIEIDNMCIVHAGWDVNAFTKKITDSKYAVNEEKDYNYIMWDRTFWSNAERHTKPNYKRVFIGHTGYNANPTKRQNIWNIDSGGGWGGYITVMDMDTEEFWQSKNAKLLYPDFKH